MKILFTPIASIVILSLLVCFSQQGFSQVSEYTFNQSTGTYSEISGGTVLFSGAYDDGTANFDLGFDFVYDGTVYTQVQVTPNGYIVFGSTDPTNGSYLNAAVISGSLITTGAVAAWAGDGSGMNNVNGFTSEIRVETIGSAPDRIAVIQYKNTRPNYSTSATLAPYINYQIRLEETTNKVSIIYGPSGHAAGSANVSTTKQIGLRGPSNTFPANVNNRTNTTSISFNSSTSGTSNASTQAYSSVNAIPGTPADGLTYTWTPPSCLTPSGITVLDILSTSAEISWVSNGSDGYEYYYSTSNIPPSGSGTFTTSTSAILSPLTPSTTYYYWVRSICGSETSNWSATYSFTTSCDPTNLPYLLDFEEVTIPAIPECTAIQNEGSGNNWATFSANSNGFTNKCLRYNYHSSSPANTWFYTQGLTLSSGITYQISYKYGNNSATFTEKMKVTIGDSPVAASMTEELADHPSITGGTPSNNSIFFTVPTNGVYYIGFNCYSIANQFSLYVDDISVDEAPTDEMDWVNIQWPLTYTMAAGSSVDIYTQGYEPGVTEANGPGAGVAVWIGLNSADTDPDTWPAGAWVTASYNFANDPNNNDEFSVTTGSTLPAGTYYYASRWQLNGGPYVYGGVVGIWNASSSGSGVLTITPPANDEPAGAISLTVNDDYNCAITTNGSTLGATQSGEAAPSCSATGINDDVWYTFTATHSSHRIAFSNVTGGTMAAALYTGTPGSLIQVPGACFSGTTLNFTGLAPSTLYYVRVYTTSALTTVTASYTICVGTPPPCVIPTALTATSITYNSATLNWTENGQATSWDIEIAVAPSYTFTGVPTVSGITSKPYVYGGLDPLTSYRFRVKPGTCDDTYWSVSSATFTTLALPPSNDEAADAISLIINGICTADPYSINTATIAANEPLPGCGNDGMPYKTLWFRFVAPESGAVKITTDFAGSTLTDNRMALYAVTDVNDYANGFINLACDEDGGIANSGYRAVIFYTGLTGGETYYVQVGGYSSSTTGSFCIEVHELDNTMLSTTNTCSSSYQSLFGSAVYDGWVSLVDNAGRLIALVRNPAGVIYSSTTAGQYVNSAAVRDDGSGNYYLDRNFSINNANAGNYDVKLFFLNTELDTLASVDPGTELSGLSVTKQDGSTCTNHFSYDNGDVTVLGVTEFGSTNGLAWVGFSTTSFSNFFITNAESPLPVTLLSFNVKATDDKQVHLVWEVSDELDIASYSIERSSDGKRWSVIGSVVATRANVYEFWDNLPVNGYNYYRLIINENDGTYTKSVIRQVNFSSDIVLTVFPNPARDQIMITGTTGNIEVTLYNELGVIVMTVKTTAEEIVSRGLMIGHLPSGSYIAQVKNLNTVKSVLFIKN